MMITKRNILTILGGIIISSLLIVLGIYICKDHHITNRDGTDEYVINLLEIKSVTQSLYISNTKNINIATSIGTIDGAEKAKKAGKICWKISANDGKSIYGEKDISEYDFNSWTNTVINVKNIKQNQYVNIELWAENVEGIANVIFIISKNDQSSIFGKFYIGTEEQPGCLQLSYFSSSGFRIYLYLWIKIIIMLSLFLVILVILIMSLKKEPIVLILIMRWVIQYIFNQPYKNFNNTMGYTLWMYSFQKLGMASRILPGTILKFFKNEISKENMLNSGLICQLLAIVIVTCFCYWLLQETKEPIKGYVKTLIIIYGTSPFFISYYISPTLFLHYDELLIVFFITCIYLAHKGTKCMYLIPIVCMCAMFTHEMYILLCFPWVFSYLIYQFAKSLKKKYLYVAIISGIVVSLVFIKIVFLNNANYDINTILNLLQSDVTDENLISSFYVSSYYTMSSADKLILDHYDAFRFDALTKLIVGIIMCSPMLIIFMRFYSALRKETKFSIHLSVILFFLSPLGIVVACYKACDFSRWAIMSIMCGVLTAITLISDGNETEANAFEYGIAPLKSIFREQWSIILVIYLLINGMGDTVNISQLSQYIVDIVESL